MKKLILLFAFVVTIITANAQLKDLTNGGQVPAGSHTYYFYDAVSRFGVPFSAHLFTAGGGGAGDTVVFTLQQQNSALGAWEDITASQTVNPADSNKLVIDTLWGRRIRVKCVSTVSSTHGKFYIVMNYGNL